MAKIRKGRGLHREAHSSGAKRGAGDFYGTGVKQPMGRVIGSYMIDSVSASKKKLGKPPKKLA